MKVLNFTYEGLVCSAVDYKDFCFKITLYFEKSMTNLSAITFQDTAKLSFRTKFLDRARSSCSQFDGSY